jgi:hypothetical protein
MPRKERAALHNHRAGAESDKLMRDQLIPFVLEWAKHIACHPSLDRE